MSNLAVTGDYFEEPVDREIANGPNIRKQSGVLHSTITEDLPESIVSNHQAIPGAISPDFLNE